MKDPVGTVPTRGETLPWWKFPHKPKVVFQQPVRSLEGFATLAAAPYTSNIVSTGTGTPKAFPTFGAAGTTASKVDQLNAFYAIAAPYDTIYATVRDYVTGDGTAGKPTGVIKAFTDTYSALNTYAPATEYTDKAKVVTANTNSGTDTDALNGTVSDITQFSTKAKDYIDATTALFNAVKGDLASKVAEYSNLYTRYNQFKTDQANVDKSAGVDTLLDFPAEITNALSSSTVQGYTYTTANVATLQGNCSTYLTASMGLRDKIRTHVQTELRDFITKFDTAYSGLAPSVKDANMYTTRLPEVAEGQTPAIATLISIINDYGGYSSADLAAAAPPGTAGKLTTQQTASSTWLLMQDYKVLYDPRLLFTMTGPTATPNTASIPGLTTDYNDPGYTNNINAVLSPTATQASIQAIANQYNTNITNWLSISRTNLANIMANYASIHSTYTALQSSFNGFKAMAPIPLGTLPATLSDTVPAALTYVSTGASGDKITVAGVTSTGGFTEYNTFADSRTNILDKFRQLVKHVSENVYGLIDQTGAADMTTVPPTRTADMAALYSPTGAGAKPDPTVVASSTVSAVSTMCDTLIPSMKKYAYLIAADVTGKYNTLWTNNSTFLTGAKETPAVSTETSDVSVTGPIYTSFTGKLSSLFSTLLSTMRTNVGNYNKLRKAYTDFKTNTASDAVTQKVTELPTTPVNVSGMITGILADGTTFTSTNAGTLTSQLSNVGLDLTVSGTGKLPALRSHVIGQLRTYIGNYETYRSGLTDVRTRGAYTSSLPIADSATAANVIGILAKYGGPLSDDIGAEYSGPSEAGTLNTQVLQDRMLDRIDDYVQSTGLMSDGTIAILTTADKATAISTTDTPAPPGGFTLESIITGASGATTGFDNTATNYTTFTDAQLNTKITKYETALTTGITTVRDRIQAIKTSYESVWDAYDTFRTGFNAFSSLPALTTTKEPAASTKKYSVIQGLSTYNAANFPTDIGMINGVRDAYVGSSPQGLRPALITEFGTKLGNASGYAGALQTRIASSALPAANKPTLPVALVASPTDDQLKTYMTDLQKATVILVVREYVQLYDNWFSTLTDAEKATAVSGSTYEGLKASLTTSYVPPDDATFATVLATYTAGNTGLQALVKAKAQGVLTSFKTFYDDNKNQGLFTDATYVTKASSAASPAGTNYAAITNDTTTNQQTAKTQYDNYIADRDSLIEEIRGKLKAVVDKYATLYNRYETFKTTQTSATIDSFSTTPSTYTVVAQDSTDLTPTFTYSDANKGTIDRLRGKYGQNNVGAASDGDATNIFPQFLFFVRFELNDYITKYGTESVKSQYDRTRPPSVSAPSADTATDADTLIAIMDAYGPVTANLLLAGSQSAVYDLITRFNTTLFYSYVYVLTEADLSTQVTGYDTIENFITIIVGQDLASYSTADETATQALSAKYNAAIAKLYQVLVDRLGTIKGNYETLHDAYTAFQTGFTSFKTMAALPAGVPKTPDSGSALPSNTYADGSFATDVAAIGTFYNKYITASTGLIDKIKGHIATNVTSAFLTEYGTRLSNSKITSKPAAVTAPSSPDLENLYVMLETLALNTATLVAREYIQLYDMWLSTLTDAEKGTQAPSTTLSYLTLRGTLDANTYTPLVSDVMSTVFSNYMNGNTGLQALVKAKAQGILTSFKSLYDENKDKGLFTDATYATKASDAASPAGTNYAAITGDTTTNQQTAKTQYDNYVTDRDSLIEEIRGKLKALVEKYKQLKERYDTFKTDQTSSDIDTFAPSPSTYVIDASSDISTLTPTFTYTDANKTTIDTLRDKYGPNNVVSSGIFPQLLSFVREELDDYITKYSRESALSKYDSTRPPSVSAPSVASAADADTLIAIMNAYGPQTAKLLLAGEQSSIVVLIERFYTTLYDPYKSVLTSTDMGTTVPGYSTLTNFVMTGGIVLTDLGAYTSITAENVESYKTKYNAAIAKLYEVLVDRLGTIKGNYETLHDAYTAFQTGFTSFKTMAALPAGVPKTPDSGSALLSNTYANGSFTTDVATIDTFYSTYVTASTGLIDKIKGHIATNVTNTGAYLTEYGTRLGSSKAATKPAAVTAPSSPDLENLKTMLETLALNTATLVYRNYQYLYTANSALVNTSMVVYGSTTASEANGAAAPSGADIAALGSTYDNYKTACETLFGTGTSNDGTVTGQLAYLKSEYNALRSKYTTFKGDSATQAAAGNPTLATLPDTTPEETTTIPTTYSDTHVGAVDTLRGSLGTSDSTSTGSTKFPLLLAFVKGELTKYINAFKVKFDAADARFRGTYTTYTSDVAAVQSAATTTALSLRNIMNGYMGTSEEAGVVAAPGLAATLTTANNRLAALNAISLFVETYGKFSTMLAAQSYPEPTEYTNLTNYFDLGAADGTDPTMGDLKTGDDATLANIKATYDAAQTTLLGNVRTALTKVIDDFAADYADAPSTALRALPGISLPTSLKSYDKTSDRTEVNQQATTIERLVRIMNNYIGATGYAPTMASTEASLSGTRTKRGDLLTAMSTYYVNNYLPFKDVFKDNKPSAPYNTDYNPTLLSQLTSYIDFSSNPIGFQNTFYNLSDSDLGSMKTAYEGGVNTLLSEARVRVTKRIEDFVGYYKTNKNLIDLPGINLDFLTIDGKTAWGTGTDADYGTDGFIKADLDSITETMTVSELKALQDKYSGTLTTGLKKQLADALGPLARTNELRGQIRTNFNTYYNLFDAFDTNVFKRYDEATKTNVQDISDENKKFRYNIPDEKYSFVKNYAIPPEKSTWELTAAAQILNNTDLEILKARFSSDSVDSANALAYNSLIADIKRKLRDVIGNFNTEATTTENQAALQTLIDRGTLPSTLSDIPKTNRDDLAIVNGTPSLTALHDLKNKYYGGSAGGSTNYPKGLFTVLSEATSLGSGSLLKRQAAETSISAFDEEWQKFRLTLFTKADSTLDLGKLSNEVKACLSLNSTASPGGLYTTGAGGGKKPNSTYLGKDDGALDSLKTQFDNVLANLASDVATEINRRIQSDYIDKFSEVDTAYRRTITGSNNVERNSVFVNLVSGQFPTLVTEAVAGSDKTAVTAAGSSKNFTSLKEYMEKYLTSNNSGQFLVNTLQSAIDAGKLKDARDNAKTAMVDYYVDTYLVYDDILGYTQATYPQALKDIVGNGTNGYIQVASTGYLTGTKFLELNSIALAQGAETMYRNAITALLGVAKGKVRDVINEYSTLLTDYETFRMDVGTAAVPTYPINLTNPANQASSDVGTLNGAGVSADTIRGFFDTYADPTSGKRDALVTFVRNQLTSYIGTFYGSYNTSDQRIRAMLSSYNVSTYNTDNGAIGTASMADMKTMMTRYAGYKVSLATASVRYEVVLAIEEYVDLLLEYKSMGLWTGPEPSEYTKISTDYFELESSKPGYPYKPSFLAITDSAQLTQIKNDYEGYKNNLSTQVVGNIEEKIQAMFTFYDLIHGDDVLSSGLSDILNSTVSTLTDDMKYRSVIVQARDYVMTDDIATKIQEMNTFIYKADLMITGRDYQQCLQKRIETANTSVWSSLMSGFGF